ncbi:hypothetical protein B0H66DRAFT_216249 [Apodospora peruviana]|uniref:Uncharacterized protein n=1 Tax=Apodospora peruviana TaxID=516989 RepID=A0AAE0ICZ5_9PEZI|nr:hypothetical protein B0H66DRAFT_216249 [Apodospora peruviana]
MRAGTVFVALFVALVAAVPEHMMEERNMVRSCVSCCTALLLRSSTDIMILHLIRSATKECVLRGHLVASTAVARQHRHISLACDGWVYYEHEHHPSANPRHNPYKLQGNTPGPIMLETRALMQLSLYIEFWDTESKFDPTQGGRSPTLINGQEINHMHTLLVQPAIILTHTVTHLSFGPSPQLMYKTHCDIYYTERQRIEFLEGRPNWTFPTHLRDQPHDGTS